MASYGACKLFQRAYRRLLHSNVWARPDRAPGRSPFSPKAALSGSARRATISVVAPELAYLGKPVTLPPAEQVCDWMYVRDAAEVFMRAYRVEGPAYRVLNVSGECRESGEINQHLRALFPQAPLTVSNEPLLMPALVKTERPARNARFHPEVFGRRKGSSFISRTSNAAKALEGVLCPTSN